MPRQARKLSGTGVYHVMHGHLLQPLCTFYAYCLMSNHIHLLLREREDTVSEVVKKRKKGNLFPTMIFELSC